MLSDRRATLERAAQRLLERETIDEAELRVLVRRMGTMAANDERLDDAPQEPPAFTMKVD